MKISKIASYENQHNTLMRETIEINLNREVCNNIAHSTLDSHIGVRLQMRRKSWGEGGRKEKREGKARQSQTDILLRGIAVI